MDTIAAVATAPGAGGIAIVRICGDKAEDIAQGMFSFTGKEKPKANEMRFGKITDETGATVDVGYFVIFRAPHSFTGEDTVELQLHGGSFVANKVLQLALSRGARQALPGEFTKRAFLNGRLDLSQAEAVCDIINANTELSLDSAVNRLDGALSQKINSIRNTILNVAAELEVAADYPEEDIDYKRADYFKQELEKASAELKNLLAEADRGRIIREGVTCAIAGKPNVGKSSLLNALLERERAIVTDIRGTTRDIVEDFINIGGIAVRLADTAGLRQADSRPEQMGIEMAVKYVKHADICIVLLDSDGVTEEDNEVLRATEAKKRIVAVNKSDINTVEIEGALNISAKTGQNLDLLKKKIAELALGVSVSKDTAAMLTTNRQRAAAERALQAVALSLETLYGGFPADLAAGDIETAAAALGEITGQTVSDEILDKIFSQFCLGK